MATKHFYQNPDFEEIFIFLNIEVPTSKKQFRPLDDFIQKKITKTFPELDKQLFFKENKENAQSFINDVKIRLLAKKKKRWPYRGKLLLLVGFTGTKSNYEQKDLDNLLKSIFDSFKGIVFIDDNQIEAVISTKQILNKNIKGCMIGLRILNNGIIDKYLPSLYSEKIETWGKAYTDKFSQTSDELFNSFEIY
jgi:Holliday junction resolvase RusA-like endonuclease